LINGDYTTVRTRVCAQTENVTVNGTEAFPSEALPGHGPEAEPESLSLDKRVVQERNRLAILRWLARFGWLTSRMIAALVWPEAAQPMAMARRTLKNLVDEKFVISRPLAKGGAAYLLASKGARLLAEQCGVEAESGNALAIGTPVHRACSNWYLIGALQRGLDIVTEHEVATERGPFRALDGKVPDGLVIADGQAIWLECEHSQKSRGERLKSVSLVRRGIGGDTMTELAPELYLARVAIVATNYAALRWMSASFYDAHRRGEVSEGQVACVDACLLPVSESLVPGERVDGNLYWDILVPAMNGPAA
jgi:hypothetical protein